MNQLKLRDLRVSAERVCDFCAAPRPAWRYPCESFTGLRVLVAGQHNTTFFVGDWAACDVCRRLIDHGDFDRLVERAVARTGVTATPAEPLVRLAVGAVFRRFDSHRLGKAVKWGE